MTHGRRKWQGWFPSFITVFLKDAKLHVWGAIKTQGENPLSSWAKKHRTEFWAVKLLDKKQRARDRESHILCLNSAPTAGWPLNHARSAQSVSSSAEDIRPEVGFELPPRDRLFAVWIRHQDYGRVNLQWFFSCENGTHFTGSLYAEPLWILNTEHCECYQESRK